MIDDKSYSEEILKGLNSSDTTLEPQKVLISLSQSGNTVIIDVQSTKTSGFSFTEAIFHFLIFEVIYSFRTIMDRLYFKEEINDKTEKDLQ